MKPTLAMTLGDPAGIGPEVVARCLADPLLRKKARFCVYGDPFVLNRACEVAHIQLDPVAVTSASQIPEGTFGLITIKQTDPLTHAFGKPDQTSGPGTYECLKRAVADAMGGDVDGIVTGPLSKEILSAATGYPEGHTELLARLTGSDRAVMMLAGPSLRVVSATSHAAIKDLPRLLTEELVLQQARVLLNGLITYFCDTPPRIAVCALNPHAGEGGLYGTEEVDTLVPAIEKLKAEGFDVEGPLPADTVFLKASQGSYDAVLAMYHDQAMIPIKLLHFANAVNVTLGLPFVRTSPAHGTAYDIAGKGSADAGSTKAAVSLAAAMVARKHKSNQQA